MHHFAPTDNNAEIQHRKCIGRTSFLMSIEQVSDAYPNLQEKLLAQPRDLLPARFLRSELGGSS